jgi:hypothetical protein
MEPTSEPRPPKRTVGEWLFQLATITLGVLIALSFDALLEWRANRALVAEARATIAREIAENRADLEANLATYEERSTKLGASLKLLDELDAGVEPTVHEYEIVWNPPLLARAGWESAERTGALALMDYAEVERLAGLYSIQQLVEDSTGTALSASARALAALSVTDDPYLLPPAAREEARVRVLEVRAILFMYDQIGRRLLEAYDREQPPE